ncbi:hypothetical protein I4U23_018061 [Adineta vaga]|nr:hypothetical protein I4U23_018061 [Adineta vaga]
MSGKSTSSSEVTRQPETFVNIVEQSSNPILTQSDSWNFENYFALSRCCSFLFECCNTFRHL